MSDNLFQNLNVADVVHIIAAVAFLWYAVFVGTDLWGSVCIGPPTLWGYFELWGCIVGTCAKINLGPMFDPFQAKKLLPHIPSKYHIGNVY